MIFTKIMTTAVVLMNADMLPTINIIIGRANNKGFFSKGIKFLASNFIEPFDSNAADMIISAIIVITAGLLNPLMASFPSMILNPINDTMTRKAVLSIVNISVTNRIVAIPIIAKRMKILIVIAITIHQDTSIARVRLSLALSNNYFMDIATFETALSVSSLSNKNFD